MMFNKSDTNTGGACLCEDCVFCDLHKVKGYYGVHIAKCRLTNENYCNVGVCKDFMSRETYSNG